MEPQNRTDKSSWLSLWFSVLASYYSSLTSNIFLMFITYLSIHQYKWIGYAFHLSSILFIFLSLKTILNYTANHLNAYRRYTQIFSITIVFIMVYYLCVIVFLWTTESDFELVAYFILSLIVWSIFHGLLIIILNAFIQTLEDRPMLIKPNPKSVDKNLRDLMLSTQ